jgi:hypothetical protein
MGAMNNYKKIMVGVISFSLLLIVIDWSIGYVSERMYYKSKYGIFRRQIYCLHESNDELQILGSSRAAHHYVPTIFTDSLGLSCYNAGSDGMCIYYQYAVLTSYIHRNAIPKMVICEVVPMDAEVFNGASFNLDAALDRLAPHYGEVPEVDSMFDLNGWKETLKLRSKSYRYNSKLVQFIKCNYIPLPEDNGYEALFGELNPKDTIIDSPTEKLAEVDSLKLRYVSKLIDVCKSNRIKLVICFSPAHYCGKSNGIDAIKRLASNNDVAFFDYSLDERFRNCKYFNDDSHLNDTGARAYSAVVAHDLRKEIKE